MSSSHFASLRWLPSVLFATVACVLSSVDAEELQFDAKDLGPAPEGVPRLEAWKTIPLDPDYGGLWVVAGDVDGDGAVEIVSAENFNEGDVHHTSAVVAHKLDGSVLWRWGDPDVGRKKWHHDVACQIHDWDGDGKNEVVVCPRGFVVALDGATGAEKKRFPIADDATDCLVFCDLGGVGRPTDVLVKDRYHRIWAFDRAGKELWMVPNPGGHRTAHQPRPMDLDGDGKDEIMAGYAMLNADGSVRWVYASKTVDQKRGHLDCARILETGESPASTRIVMTCCGANNIAVVNGVGEVVWEVPGHHFESIQVGRLSEDDPGPHILVDIDHEPMGNGPLWIFDKNGKHVGRLVTPYSRHHRLLDWTGDGVDEILVGHTQALYNCRGKRIVTLASEGVGGDYETNVLVGDMSGDGVPDILVAAPGEVWIYKNEDGKRPVPPAPLGTGLNVTLY